MVKNHILIEDILIENYIKDSSHKFNYQIYEAIAKDKFIESDLYPYPQSRVEDGENGLLHLLEKRKNKAPFNPTAGSKEKDTEWKLLMAKTILDLDDWTGDVYDIVRLLWTQQTKTQTGFITLTPEDILQFRQVKPLRLDKEGKPVYRKRDIFKAMDELTKLLSLSLTLGKAVDEVEVDENTGLVINVFESEEFKSLFYVGDFTMFYQNDEPKGFSKVTIRPGEILSDHFLDSSQPVRLLSTFALKYNPITQKYHKRLARYFSLCWDIGQKIKNLSPSFRIGGDSGLLSVMGIDMNEGIYKKRPFEVQEVVAKTLDKLKEDNVIGTWKYATKDGLLDPVRVGKNNWIEEYYLPLRVIVTPPDSIRQYYRIDEEEVKAVQEFLTVETEVQLVLKGEISLTPQILLNVRDRLGMKDYHMAKAAQVTPSTLSRFLSSDVTNLRKGTEQKLLVWLEEVLPKLR